MVGDLDPCDVGQALHMGISLLMRRLSQAPTPGDLSVSEGSALSRLVHGGPATPSELARQERISQQSMGATLAALHERGLVARAADPTDGRRVLLSTTLAGDQALAAKRTARAEQMSGALGTGFSAEELAVLLAAAPLLERLARNI